MYTVVQKATLERQLEDGRRRSWLLERVAEDLEHFKENLSKMRDIAVSFQQQNDSVDVQVYNSKMTIYN